MEGGRTASRPRGKTAPLLQPPEQPCHERAALGKRPVRRKRLGPGRPAWQTRGEPPRGQRRAKRGAGGARGGKQDGGGWSRGQHQGSSAGVTDRARRQPQGEGLARVSAPPGKLGGQTASRAAEAAGQSPVCSRRAAGRGAGIGGRSSRTGPGAGLAARAWKIRAEPPAWLQRTKRVERGLGGRSRRGRPATSGQSGARGCCR